MRDLGVKAGGKTGLRGTDGSLAGRCWIVPEVSAQVNAPEGRKPSKASGKRGRTPGARGGLGGWGSESGAGGRERPAAGNKCESRKEKQGARRCTHPQPGLGRPKKELEQGRQSEGPACPGEGPQVSLTTLTPGAPTASTHTLGTLQIHPRRTFATQPRGRLSSQCPHFTDGETEAQTGSEPSSRSQRREVSIRTHAQSHRQATPRRAAARRTRTPGTSPAFGPVPGPARSPGRGC